MMTRNLWAVKSRATLGYVQVAVRAEPESPRVVPPAAQFELALGTALKANTAAAGASSPPRPTTRFDLQPHLADPRPHPGAGLSSSCRSAAGRCCRLDWVRSTAIERVKR